MDLLTMIDSARAVIDKLSLIFTVITVAVALLQCYAGYRMLRFWISLAGGLIGFAAGFGISYVNLKNTPVFIPVLIGVAAAALLGFLAFRLYLAVSSDAFGASMMKLSTWLSAVSAKG